MGGLRTKSLVPVEVSSRFHVTNPSWAPRRSPLVALLNSRIEVELSLGWGYVGIFAPTQVKSSQVKSSQVVGLLTRVASIRTLIFSSPHPYAA
jgi:hypothetical protein